MLLELRFRGGCYRRPQNFGVVEARLTESLVQPYGARFLAALGGAASIQQCQLGDVEDVHG